MPASAGALVVAVTGVDVDVCVVDDATEVRVVVDAAGLPEVLATARLSSYRVTCTLRPSFHSRSTR